MITRRAWFGTVAAAAWANGGADLWDPSLPVPKAAGLETVAGARFFVLKPHEPARDGGYGFLHGVALCWHKGKLYTSFGHNRGKENTTGEEARGRISTDGGRTAGDVFTIDAGDEPDLAVSHGSFLSHRGRLWAFQGAFHGSRTRVHTRAYVLDEKTGHWRKMGTVVRDGFWPMQQPVRMGDGNWIMAGFRVGEGEPASVAISRGSDFTRWDHVAIPRDPGIGKMWGESTVIVEGRRVWNIARYGGEPVALVSSSEDAGRTWTAMRPSNLPMAGSKPYAGVLSSGQRYLICTTAADTGNRRAPLTIAVSRPGERLFRRVFRIRGGEFPEGPGDSHPRASLSYPYAVEYRGNLYTGYSNNGGRVGMNINSAELAVLPVTSLKVE